LIKLKMFASRLSVLVFSPFSFQIFSQEMLLRKQKKLFMVHQDWKEIYDDKN